MSPDSGQIRTGRITRQRDYRHGKRRKRTRKQEWRLGHHQHKVIDGSVPDLFQQSPPA